MPPHSTDSPFRRLTVNQFVAQPLVISLAVIMSDKLRDGPPMMAFTERNQAIQTFLWVANIRSRQKPLTLASPSALYGDARRLQDRCCGPSSPGDAYTTSC